jgi:hypothetical protein
VSAGVATTALRCAFLAAEASLLKLAAPRPERLGAAVGRLLRDAYELADAGAHPNDLRMLMAAAGLRFEGSARVRAASTTGELTR